MNIYIDILLLFFYLFIRNTTLNLYKNVYSSFRSFSSDPSLKRIACTEKSQDDDDDVFVTKNNSLRFKVNDLIYRLSSFCFLFLCEMVFKFYTWWVHACRRYFHATPTASVDTDKNLIQIGNIYSVLGSCSKQIY